MTVSPARVEAHSTLMEVGKSANVYADDLLRGARVSRLSAQDRNLCTTLVLGTLRWQIRLDAAIRTKLVKPNAKLDAAVQIALRLGLFQLWYLDRIPAHAAIGESVSLARLAGHQHGSRMVNAVLRALSREAKPEAPELPRTAVPLAEATAHPTWMVERWIANFGVDVAQAICLNGQAQPELDLRLETPELEAELAGQGIELAPGAILSAARRVVSGDVTATEASKSGRVRIQEEGSQLIAELGGDDSFTSKTILDCCAAPGGKTLILAERNSQAKVTALEISPGRCAALRERVATSRFAAQIEVAQADATQMTIEGERYDLVLADVPCSGTGTMGRNPEIRHRLRLEDLARHHDRQVAILRSALAVGSRRVIYSTCSLEPEENQAVVAEVLEQTPDWRQVSVASVLGELRDEGRLTLDGGPLVEAVAEDGALTILPGSLGADIQTDGFFVAILERLA